MRIKTIDNSDIPVWVELSREYDRYILEIVPSLTEWYEGNGELSVSFDKYMESKIIKNEAFMVIGDDGGCCGIIAISVANSRITFFAISHKCDFMDAGDILLNHALSKMSVRSSITTNIVKSDAEPFQKQHALFKKYGFTFSHYGLENGVPVSCMERKVQT